MRTIQVTKPIIVHQCKHLFIKKSYSIHPLKIKELRNVIVTPDGICFQNSEIVKESVQAYPDKVKIFELSGLLQLKTRPTIQLHKDSRYLLIFHPWINYYHWFTESIPRLWLARDLLNDTVVLLPESYKQLNYVMESLLPFNLKNVEYFPDGNNVKIRCAIIPQIKPVCSDYDPRIVSDLRKFYVEFARNSGRIPPVKNDKVYIIRGNSTRRKIVNEYDVTVVLSKYGFCPINATTLSFFDQVILSDQTHFLISNGSGLTNMHFMKTGASVMELIKRITNLNDFHDRVLRCIAPFLFAANNFK